MGRASISIAITSNFNGKGVDAAIRKMEQLAVSSVAAQGKFGKAAVQAGSSLGKASHLVSNFGQAMAKVGDTLTTHVTIPMGIAAAAAIKSAVDIDTAWYNVRKTVDMTEDGYQQLKQGAIELSNVQPVSAETILNIEALGGQLGISNDHLESFAKTVSGLDISTNLNADEAATSLARFANIVQMSEDDFDNFGSALVDLGNHSATTESEIMDLALRFASAGHVAGMSNQEILGISASLSALGMKADAGGSALSQVINKISLDVDTNGEHIEAWAQLAGKSVEDFKKAWKTDAAGTFEDVLQGIAKSGDEMNAVLDDVGVTQIRTSDAMRRLASSGDLMSESIKRANTAWQENTALSREVENRNESLASRFEVIKNRLTNAMATIGEPIAEMALKALDGLEPLIQGAQDLATAFANADPVTQQFAFNLGATAMAAGPVLSIMGRGIDFAGKFGVQIARASQQFGIFLEALKTTNVSMLQNLASNETFASKLGLTHNALTKAAGGADKLKASIAGATESVKVQAKESERAKIYSEQLAKGINQEGKSYEEASKAAYEYLDSTKAQNRVKKAQTKAQKDMSSSIMDTARNAERARIYNEALTDAMDRQGMSYEKAAKQANKVVNSGESQARIAKAQADALKEVALSTEEGSQAYNKYLKSAENAHTGLTNLKNVLLGIGGIAIGAAAFAGIEYLATQAQTAAEHAELFHSALTGLREASSQTAVSLDSQATALGNVSQAHESIGARVERSLTSQAQLAESIRQTNTEANVQIGSLNRAYSTIEQYANKAGLSAAEQYRLQQAIQTVNDACGTQYTVVDAANGRIADETGTIQENTEAIKSNVEAIKQQIQAKAIQTNLEGLYAQATQHEQELGAIYAENSEKIDKNREILEKRAVIADKMSKITNKNSKEYADLAWQLAQVNSEYDHSVDGYFEIEQALGVVREQIAANEQQLESVIGSVDKLGGSIQQFFAGSGQSGFLEQVLGGSKHTLEEFSAACEDAGLSVDDLKNISHDSLEQLASNFDGTADSVLDALGRTEEGRAILERLGYTVDQTGNRVSKLFEQFRNAPEWTGAFEGAAHGLDEFATKCQQAGINFESLNALGSENIKALADNFDGSTQSIVDSLQGMGEQGQTILNNIGQNWYSGLDSASQGLVDSIQKTQGLASAEIMAMAQDLRVQGEAATRLFLEGLNSGASAEDAASAARKITNAFETELNPSQVAAVAAAYSKALSENMNPQEAADKATQTVQQIMDATANLDPGVAASVMQAFASALNSGATFDQATSSVEDAINRIEQATNGLDPGVASAAMQAFAAALNNGATFDEAATGVESAIQQITEATNGLDPGVATAAMQAFANALNQGATFDEAKTNVENAIQQITEATNGLDPSVATAAMQAFANALGEGMNLEQAIQTALEQVEQLKSGVQDSLNNASFDSSGWQAKFAEFGRVGPEAFNQSLQSWGPILSDTTGQIVTNAANGVNPHVEIWSQRGNEGPQAFNNALTPWSSTIFATTSEIANQSVSGLEIGIPGAGTAGSETSSNYANMIGTMQGTAVASAIATQIAVVLAYKAGIEVALTAGQMTGQNYGTGLQQGMSSAVDTVNQSVASMSTAFSSGMVAAATAGAATGTAYALTLALGLAVGVSAAQNAASMIGTALSSSVGAAASAGSAAGSGYALSLAVGLAVAVNAAQNAASMVGDALNSTVDPASSAGTAAGTAYATNLALGFAVAIRAAQRTVTMIASYLRAGVSPAGSAGRATGSAYSVGVSTARTAISTAASIAAGVGSAFASTVGWAYSSGYAMGSNYAAGVAAGGSAAIDAARSIASQVAAILHHSTPKEGPLKDDDVWGLHFAQNLARGIKQGAPAVAAAANQVAASMAVPAAAAKANYALAQGTLTKAVAPINTGSFITNSQLRSYTGQVDRSSDAYKAGVSITKNYTREINNSSPGINYDTMYSVVEAGVASALKKSGAAHPVVYLDGRQVSKQLANFMDSELGRLQRSRG